MALLEIIEASKRFGAVAAVDRVSLSIERGEFFALLGPSGCGKTTLLRLIAGFETPDQGRIVIDNQDGCHGNSISKMAPRGLAIKRASPP